MIDLEQARDLLKQAVATQGEDFVYTPHPGRSTCYYVPLPDADGDDPRGKTGCVVGVALTLAGETRQTIDNGPANVMRVHGFAGTISGLALTFPDMMTDEARDYFGQAQVAQDNGATWGQALAQAEASLA